MERLDTALGMDNVLTADYRAVPEADRIAAARMLIAARVIIAPYSAEGDGGDWMMLSRLIERLCPTDYHAQAREGRLRRRSLITEATKDI